MRIALEYIRIAFTQSIQYRFELTIWVFLTIINTFALLLVWINITGNPNAVAGYSFAAIAQYYFIVTVVNTLTASHFESWRSSQVKDGKIDTLLTKPVSYPQQVLFQDLGGKLFWALISIPLLALSYLLLAQFVTGLTVTLSLWNAVELLGLLIFAYWLEFCLAFATVIATFWFESAEGLQHFKWIVISIFSGFVIPISYMPEWLKTIVDVLPFKYLYAAPAGIIQGTSTLTIHDWLYIGAVAICSTIVIQTMWHHARRHYASAGG